MIAKIRYVSNELVLWPVFMGEVIGERRWFTSKILQDRIESDEVSKVSRKHCSDVTKSYSELPCLTLLFEVHRSPEGLWFLVNPFYCHMNCSSAGVCNCLCRWKTCPLIWNVKVTSSILSIVAVEGELLHVDFIYHLHLPIHFWYVNERPIMVRSSHESVIVQYQSIWIRDSL